MQVLREETDARHGRYVARIEGVEGEGELTFTRRGPGRLSADHTGVPESMAGEGVARALLDALLADARKEGFHIIPYCPYVRGQYARHPEWSDLFTTAPGEEPSRG
ncbi:GNAT family N-acetyltransferase [Neomegalonema sp.]|uniref:GNAT family N-acetyltransferase n=1 Tax=Neomegalonema sp. TaxID=2039713 RepID=UPI00262DBADF|nr:GNAT family N-acetyltransferase [Neomegalonema sp.]MDD2867351.1 GNAT family N-acetyltransferase [Neomegalonema sp.]